MGCNVGCNDNIGTNMGARPGKLPSVNNVIDNWVLDGNRLGDVTLENRVRMQPTGLSTCTFIDAKLHVQDVKQYDRQVLFTPHQKYDSMKGIILESRLLTIPKRFTSS